MYVQLKREKNFLCKTLGYHFNVFFLNFNLFSKNEKQTADITNLKIATVLYSRF